MLIAGLAIILPGILVAIAGLGGTAMASAPAANPVLGVAAITAGG